MYSRRNQSGPPGWIIFLMGMAFVFGLYYVYIGLRDYLETGGMTIAGATQLARELATNTAVGQITFEARLPTRRPTLTPPPPCQTFVVAVPSGIVRRQPTTAAELVETLAEGAEVCVIQAERGGDGWTWYLIDQNTATRRIEAVYMREDILRPLNPTLTPSNTAPPPPTITPTFTHTSTRTPTPGTITPSRTVTPRPSRTPRPASPAPSITPLPDSPTPVPATPTTSQVNI